MHPNNDQSTNWSQTFPLPSYLQTTLREILIEADHHRRQADQSWHQLQHELHLTGLPMHHWHPRTHRQLQYARRHHLYCHRHFAQALKNLEHHHHPNPPTPEPASPTRKPAHKPEPERLSYIPENHKPGVLLCQNTTIQVIDGQTITDCKQPAAQWCQPQDFSGVGAWERQLYFPEAIIPCQYTWVLKDPDGSHHPPAPYINIRYEPAEFLSVCQLEFDTNSEHLLPGVYTHVFRGL